MAVTTVTGSAATTTLLVSTGTGITVTVGTSGSLLQTTSVSITGTGTTVLFLGHISSDDDNNCQVELSVDDTVIFSGAAGDQVIARVALTAAVHTVTYTAYALNVDAVVSVAGLTAIDLGL